MINIKDYYTERLINGKIVRVFTKEDQHRYRSDERKLMKLGKIRMNNETKKEIDRGKKYYSYCKSFGGFPFQENNSLLKIDVDLFL